MYKHFHPCFPRHFWWQDRTWDRFHKAFYKRTYSFVKVLQVTFAYVATYSMSHISLLYDFKLFCLSLVEWQICWVEIICFSGFRTHDHQLEAIKLESSGGFPDALDQMSWVRVSPWSNIDEQSRDCRHKTAQSYLPSTDSSEIVKRLSPVVKLKSQVFLAL